MNIIFLKVNIALFGNPSIFAVDYESIDNLLAELI